MEIKNTIKFGITPALINRIELEKEKFKEFPEVIYLLSFWKPIAKEFSWEPMTLSLYYFKYLNNKFNKSLDNIIQTNKDKLNNLKNNLSKCEEEKWKESEISECENMIKTLASVLSELNKLKNN